MTVGVPSVIAAGFSDLTGIAPNTSELGSNSTQRIVLGAIQIAAQLAAPVNEV